MLKDNALGHSYLWACGTLLISACYLRFNFIQSLEELRYISFSRHEAQDVINVSHPSGIIAYSILEAPGKHTGPRDGGSGGNGADRAASR